MPGALFGDANTQPLDCDGLLPLSYWTTGVFGPPSVHLVGVLVEVGKEDGGMELGLNVNVCVPEVG